MIIVCGRLRTSPDERDAYLATCRDVVTAARAAQGCLEFVVAADPLEPGCIVVLERWASREDVEAFRGDGPGDDLSARLLEADVAEYEVAAHRSLTG